MTCSGDSTSYCGAGNRLTVYIKNGTSSASVSSSGPSSISSILSQSSGVSLSSASSSTLSDLPSGSASNTQSSSSSFPSSVGSISSSSTTSSAPTPSQTLAISRIVGKYAFQGCYTEGNGARALSGASFYNYTAMTLEMCAFSCTGFTYWGVEYGGECARSHLSRLDSKLTLLQATVAILLILPRRMQQRKLIAHSLARAIGMSTVVQETGFRCTSFRLFRQPTVARAM